MLFLVLCSKRFGAMCKTLFNFILYTFFILIPVVALGQNPDGDEFGMEQMGDEEEEEEEKIVESKIGLWNTKGYGALIDSTFLDTLHDYSHIYHPVYKNTITATFTGNYGNASLDNNFFNRNYLGNYFLSQSREPYILSHSELDYYNTTTPYTRLDFSQSENNETRFNVIHSRNITPFWNFTFRTNQEKSDGQYNNQESRNNFVTLYTHYDRDNWNVSGGFISSSVENEENGGIVADSLLSVGSSPEFWATNLAESQTKIGNTHYFANAEYRIGKWLENEDETETFRGSARVG